MDNQRSFQALGPAVRAMMSAPTTPLDEQTNLAKEAADRGLDLGPFGAALNIATDPGTWLQPEKVLGMLPFMMGGLKAVKGAKAAKVAEEALSAARVLSGAEKVAARAAADPFAIAAPAATRSTEEVAPKISKARHGGTVRSGQYVGAPPGVDSPQKFGAMVKNYVSAMQEGIGGREWYRKVSDDLYARAAGNTKVADEMADNLAVLSPANSVGGNANMSRNSHIQAMTGDPISSARFPETQLPALEEVYSGNRDFIGLKRDPFSRQMSVKWAPERVGRGVNDMHEARLMGYPDGQTVSEANHAFMDRVRAKAIEIANEKKLGGFDDWDTGTSQASAWVGSKMRQGQIKPGQEGKHFGDYLSRFEANATYESTPGEGVGHLGGLLDAPYAERLQFDQDPRGSWDTEFGNDALYASQGMLPGRTVETVGRFRDEINPARVATPVVASSAANGPTAGALFPGSKRALNSTEAFRAYMDAQNAGAANTGAILEGTSPQSTGMVLNLGRAIDPDTMRQVAGALEPKGYWLASDKGGGVTILSNEGSATGEAMAKEVRQALKAAKVPTVGTLKAAPVETVFTSYADLWKQGKGTVTKQMLDAVAESPTTMAAFEKDARIPDILLGKNARDVEFANTYGVARADILKAREIFASAAPGTRFAALKKAAEQGIVPAFLVGALLQETSQPEPQPAASWRDIRTHQKGKR